jgi:hypothetical protein
LNGVAIALAVLGLNPMLLPNLVDAVGGSRASASAPADMPAPAPMKGPATEWVHAHLPHFAGVLMMLLALAPLATLLLMAVKRGLYTLDGRGKAAGVVTFAVLAPALALATRAGLDFELTDARGAIIAGAAGGAALALLFGRVDPSARGRFPFAALFIVLGVYVYGAVVQANCRLDAERPAMDQAWVIDKVRARGLPPAHRLKLTRGGPWKISHIMDVDRDVFDAAIVGDSVDVVTHPGLLHIRWVSVAPSAINIPAPYLPAPLPNLKR